MPKKNPNITIIGGGTGTYTVLTALKNENVNLTALMTMVDDGGSNKVLRDEFGLLPTSGIRQAMVALTTQEEGILRKLFTYRYHQGKSVAGMTFGNLFMAAMADIFGDQKKAIQETAKLLQVKGNIVPISYDDVRLIAKYEDGNEVIGEHEIDEPKHDGKLKIKKLYTIPKAKISPEARKAILESDFIILGPGDFYTNTVANLVIKGVPEAIKKSKAKLIFITNLMTKYGEAYDYKVSDYLLDLDKYLPLENLDLVLINSDTKFPSRALKKYQQEHSKPVEDDLDEPAVDLKLSQDLQIIRAPLLSREIQKSQLGDNLNRSILRHSPELLKKQIRTLIK